MTGNKHYTKLIEDYFEGSLSSSERADLEHQLEIDPDLKSEFDLQSTIIETIRETRMVELKSHLNNIHVGWHHMIPNSWKVAAGISLVSVSSLSAFLLLEDTFNPKSGNIDITRELKVEPIEIDDSTIPQIPEVTIIKEEPKKEIFVLEEKIQEVPLKKEVVTEETIIQQPVVVIPDMPDDFEEMSNPDPMSDVGEEIKTFEPVTSSSSVLNMTTISDKKYKFHYTLTDGQLSLYGNFKDSPYEIMELNSSQGIQMFLYYKNNYYNLKKNTVKASPLEPVSESTLITELDILRENK